MDLLFKGRNIPVFFLNIVLKIDLLICYHFLNIKLTIFSEEIKGWIITIRIYFKLLQSILNKLEQLGLYCIKLIFFV